MIVTVRTRFLPPVSFSVDPLDLITGSGGGSQGQGAALSVVQPAVTVGPVSYAPAGDPGNQWIAWVGGACVLAALVLARIVR